MLFYILCFLKQTFLSQNIIQQILADLSYKKNYNNPMSFSRRKQSEQKPHLISKYGLKSVEALINHLERSFEQEREDADLKKTQKLRDQLQYLKLQMSRHVKKQKHQIIDHIMECLQDEKINIIAEFEEDRKKQLSELVTEMQGIQQQLQIEHLQQLKQQQLALNQQLDSFTSKTSNSIISLTHQLSELCKNEKYEQAQRVKNLLQKQYEKQNNKQYYEWRNHKEKQLKTLLSKQEKQRNSLQIRLQSVLDQQIKDKNEQFRRLIKKIDINRQKIKNSLIKQNKYKSDLSSLASSRFLMRSSRTSRNSSSGYKVSFELGGMNEPETGPSSQAQTDRIDHTPQKSKIS